MVALAGLTGSPAAARRMLDSPKNLGKWGQSGVVRPNLKLEVCGSYTAMDVLATSSFVHTEQPQMQESED